GDVDRVGATLLKIDDGIDTGPVYEYLRYPLDERAETHVRIQWRCVLENLDTVAGKLLAIHAGQATTIDTSNRASAVLGQPRLTAYLRWKLRVYRGRKCVP